MSDTKPLVFIVDDVAENIQIAISHLKALDCDFAYARSGEQALARIAELQPQLILMDVMMPGLSGFETVKKLQEDPLTRSIPVIFLTALSESEDVVQGFSLGGVDYISKPFKGMELRSRVRNHLELYAYRTRLENLVAERTREIEVLKDVAIEAMGEMAEYRHKETGDHIRRTMQYVRILANKTLENGQHLEQLTPAYIDMLYKSAPLHDIGKVAIPDGILLKPGKLTQEEFEIMKRHTTYGEEIIYKLEEMAGQTSSFLQCAKEITGTHHEHFDGSGYPRGLIGEDIPLSGRIMIIDKKKKNLEGKRIYKPALSHDEAVRLLAVDRKKDFDPHLLEAFLQTQGEFDAIANRYADPPQTEDYFYTRF